MISLLPSNKKLVLLGNNVKSLIEYQLLDCSIWIAKVLYKESPTTITVIKTLLIKQSDTSFIELNENDFSNILTLRENEDFLNTMLEGMTNNSIKISAILGSKMFQNMNPDNTVKFTLNSANQFAVNDDWIDPNASPAFDQKTNAD